MSRWVMAISSALIFVMVSGGESWGQTKPRKVPMERAKFLERSYVRTWAGVTENGGFDPYAMSKPVAIKTRKELEAEVKLYREMRAARMRTEQVASNNSSYDRGEMESREWPTAGENGVILTSWYGPGFQGKPTASGEKFDMNEISAAHKDWPIGTKILLRNIENGLTVIVVINDRGPYYEERGLDLSLAAAKALGMVEEGVVWLEYTIIEVPMQ